MVIQFNGEVEILSQGVMSSEPDLRYLKNRGSSPLSLIPNKKL